MISALEPDDPRAVGPYRILNRLGGGGMGTVFLGADAHGRVAVKVIHADLAVDAGFRARFEAEVSAAERVASFCTAAVIGHGLVEGRPYLATEYIDGPTLLSRVSANGPLPPDMLLHFATGVATALVAIHSAGLVHRDLKPSNVILSPAGPRIIDFGIARPLDATQRFTATGELIGSPGWIAPEQLLFDKVTPAVDVYTWGCLVAYAGLGRHAFGSGDELAMASRMLNGQPDLTGLGLPLLPLVAAALGKDPELRPTARGLLMSLHAASTPQTVVDPVPYDEAETRPVGTRVEIAPAEAEPKPGRTVLYVALILLGIALVVAAVATFYQRNAQEPSPVLQTLAVLQGAG